MAAVQCTGSAESGTPSMPDKDKAGGRDVDREPPAPTPMRASSSFRRSQGTVVWTAVVRSRMSLFFFLCFGIFCVWKSFLGPKFEKIPYISSTSTCILSAEELTRTLGRSACSFAQILSWSGTFCSRKERKRNLVAPTSNQTTVIKFIHTLANWSTAEEKQEDKANFSLTQFDDQNDVMAGLHSELDKIALKRGMGILSAMMSS
jgi:hypothetical protein